MVVLFLGLFMLFVLFLGPTNAVRALPFIGLLWLLFTFFGFIIINFFPVILILLIISYFRNKNKPKSSSRTHYYHFGGNQDFEEFFRRTGGHGGHYQGTGSGYGSNNFGGFEDTTKYYTTLGIHKGATQEEIKKAYREMARKHHPDRYATSDDDVKDYHEKKFKEINEAYEKLTRGAV